MARKITRFGLGLRGSFICAFALIFVFCAFLSPLRAEETLDTNLWRRASSFSLNSLASNADIHPDSFLAFNLDHSRLQFILSSAPKEMPQSAKVSTALITLPMPDGKLKAFRFVESP